MDDNEPRKPSTSSLGCFTASVVVLVVCYVLSAGPVTWVVTRPNSNPRINELLGLPYFPLAWLRDNCKPIGDVLDWYCDLWLQGG